MDLAAAWRYPSTAAFAAPSAAAERQHRQPPTTLFSHFIAATVGGVLIVTAACLWIANMEIAEFAREDGEFHNEMLARTIQTAIQPELVEWIAAAPSVAAEDVQNDPRYQALEEKLNLIIAIKDILKAEIYLPNGKIIYNNGIHEFGDQVQSDNIAFWRAAKGEKYTEVEFNELVLKESGEEIRYDCVSSYIPLNFNNEVIGVFEIYIDYSIIEEISSRHFPVIATWVVIGFMILYFWIALYVWRAQRALVSAWTAEDLLKNANNQLYVEKRAAEQANEAKSTFLATLSHELRSPLHAVIGFSEEGLKRGAKLPANAAQDYFGQIKEAGASLLTLVNALLDMSRLDAGAMSASLDRLDPAETIRVIVDEQRPFAEKRGDRLEITVVGAPFEIVSDEMKLRQILRNLIENAIKFTDDGVVSIALKRGADPVRPIEIVVADTGVGIAEADQAAVFTPFIQAEADFDRRHGGAGLGLAIVSALCDLLDCEIDVVSRKGEGSAFTVRLPEVARPS